MNYKRLTAILCAGAFITLSGCGAAETKKEEISIEQEAVPKTDSVDVMEKQEDEGVEQEMVIVSAKDAVLDGCIFKDTEAEKAICYSEDDGCIIGLGEFSSASYNLKDIVPGNYDIYLNVSKASGMVCGSTPVTVSVNGGSVYIPTVAVQPPSAEQMSADGEPIYQQDMGLFLVEANVTLGADDTIIIGGVPGNEFKNNDVYTSAMPAIGDLALYPAGTEVEQGYKGSTFTLSSKEKDPSDPLSGLNIAWLGSSVTYGLGANGYSMADEIAANHDATVSNKYAISGTTLADYASPRSLPTDGEGSHGSYVHRLEMLDTNQDYDLFIVQLSTNDATGGIPMGEISADTDINNQDTKTVIGAMEYIIAYVRKNWGCPVMFYTGTKYESEQYGDMVEALLLLKEKWGIGVIDLWNNEEMNTIDEDTRSAYIYEDGIHPLKDGYVKWWTPVFEKEITEYLTSK
ncbi:SGNH/GDSL hydrolase family protein [Butyrivibrio sp. AE3004]|uniref:SGNH/GDSL hydrolase family protein n=1 Tax=Butyrivibrio sp. AE3004 TaxID=1506994 RepID=UPI00068B362E|nr:SGNH/GDSL hydrolase family protein [Butyrivibrio sp. AE3004]